MCFSPEISFIASAVITVTGLATLHKVTMRKEVLFALIPLIFAMQQFTEGLLWITLIKAGMQEQQYWFTQAYAVFVGIIWPVLIPVSIMLIEEQKERRKFFLVFTAMGLGVAVYTIYGLVIDDIGSKVVNQCIKYNYPRPQKDYLKWIYVIIVSMPFFVSGKQTLHKIGLVNIIMFFWSYYMYNETYVSVWCFFAAVLSEMIYFYFRDKDKKYITRITPGFIIK